MMETGGDATPPQTLGELAPLGFGDILENVFKICWRGAKTFLAIVGILIIPANLLFVVALLMLPPDLLAATGTYAQPDVESIDLQPYIGRLIAAGVVALGGVLIAIIGTAAATGATYVAAESYHVDLDLSWRRCIRTGFRRMGSIMWVYFLTGLGLFLSFAVVLAPGLVIIIIDQNIASILLIIFTTLLAFTVSGWLWLCWILAPAVVVTDDERGTKALKRSYNLVKGKFWWIGGIVVTAMIIGSFVGSIFTLPVAFASFTVFGNNIVLDVLVRTVANLFALLVSFPLQIAAMALLYVDARVRKEGLTRAQLQAELQR